LLLVPPEQSILAVVEVVAKVIMVLVQLEVPEVLVGQAIAV
jgi:hypothetical protein